MSQSPYDDRLGGTAPTVTPTADLGPLPTRTPTGPPTATATPPIQPPPTDNSAAQAALEDLQLQETVLAQILEVIEEAGRLVTDGQPRWVDPDVFGGSRKGVRLARHTVRAQARVLETLDQAMAALAQHHGSLTGFRDDVRRVEAETVDDLAVVSARLGGVTS